ncbi:MAG: FKBP-type peptidyl-prolyl cis-trans isomerase, partial [Acidothermaceae bacterium]
MTLFAGSAAAALVLVAGCSSSKSGAATASTSPSSNQPAATNSQLVATGSEPTVTGAFDAQPTIAIPKTKPPTATKVDVVTKGTGKPVATGDLAVVNGYGRTWTSATAFENTFGSDTPPDTLPVGTGQISMTGLDKALLGVPIGSRVLIVIPPSEGFGEISSLPTGVKKTDTAVLVFDVIASYAANAGPSGSTVSSGGGALPTVT